MRQAYKRSYIKVIENHQSDHEKLRVPNVYT